MAFFRFWTPKKKMLKHDFYCVVGAERHAGADGFVIIGLKMDLWAFFSQIWTAQNTKANLCRFFHFGLRKKYVKHDFLGVKGAEKHAGADGFVKFSLKMDLWAFFSQLRTAKNTKANLWHYFHFGLRKKYAQTWLFGCKTVWKTC